MKRPASLFTPIVVGVSALFFVSYATIAYLKYRNFEWSTFDVTSNLYFWDLIFSRWWHTIAWDEAQIYLQSLLVQPIALVFALLRVVIRSDYLPIVANVGAVSATIPLLYFWGRKQLHHESLALAAAMAFALNPFVSVQAIMGFRYDNFAPVFWLLMLSGHQARNKRLFWIGFILSCATKANILIINTVLCFLLARKEPAAYLNRAWKVSMVWLAVLVAVQVTLLIVSPLGDTGALAPGLIYQSVVAPIVADPAAIVPFAADYFGSGAGMWLFHALISVLFLPLLALWWLLPVAVEGAYTFAFSLAIPHIPKFREFFAAMVEFGNVHLYVAIFFVFFLHLASIDGAEKITRKLTGKNGRRILVAVWLLVAVIHHWFYTNPVLGPVPLTAEFNTKFYQQTEHQQNLEAAFSSLSRNLETIGNGGFREHFGTFGNRRMRSVEGYRIGDKIFGDQIIIDFYSFTPFEPRNALLEKSIHFLTHSDFGVVSFVDGIVILRRGHPNSDNARVFAWIKSNRDSLLRNLLNPYTAGKNAKGNDRAYAKTQLHAEDR